MRSDDFLAYLDGEWTNNRGLSIPIYDSGFVQGLTVSEQLRTFGGKLFRLDAHLRRLKRSLELVGVSLPVAWEDLREIAERVARDNHARLANGDDLGLTMFVTPGPYAALAPEAPRIPLLCVHSQPLAYASWANKYEAGQQLVISSTRQISPRNWPPELKCRSRMHYHLADLEASRAEPGARALLLDLEGHVSEASTANIFAYFADGGFVAPLREKILPGVTLDTWVRVSDNIGIPFMERDLTPAELFTADEVLLCSTSPCILPVVRIDGRSIGGGVPGPMYRKLLELWNELVGIRIDDQARNFASA